MFGLTDKLIAIAAGIGCLVLTGLLLIQTGALHKAERRADKAVTELANERTLWADERTRAAEALAVATTKARETEHTLAVEAEKAEHEKQTQIAAVSARADDLRRRLRIAEASAATARLMSATGAIASAPEAAGLRDGAVIPERVGDGLVQLAQRADRVRLQLASCEASYERAMDTLSR